MVHNFDHFALFQRVGEIKHLEGEEWNNSLVPENDTVEAPEERTWQHLVSIADDEIGDADVLVCLGLNPQPPVTTQYLLGTAWLSTVCANRVPSLSINYYWPNELFTNTYILVHEIGHN